MPDGFFIAKILTMFYSVGMYLVNTVSLYLRAGSTNLKCLQLHVAEICTLEGLVEQWAGRSCR